MSDIRNGQMLTVRKIYQKRYLKKAIYNNKNTIKHNSPTDRSMFCAANVHNPGYGKEFVTYEYRPNTPDNWIWKYSPHICVRRYAIESAGTCCRLRSERNYCDHPNDRCRNRDNGTGPCLRHRTDCISGMYTIECMLSNKANISVCIVY